ncbi:DUF7389 domain-containing protein [Haloarchaeobius sp. DFWS5]|uniref:DUF7389 domain-containing protein n=1 Tax=Haloarchaeobius sp. DFWS5 TaxID=3446114 RepID=UPI003EBE9402
MSDEPFALTVKLTRGTGSKDKDEFKVDIEAGDIDELDDRVEAIRERAQKWSADFRAIQPDSQTGRRVDDDQQALGEVGSP